MNTGYIYALIDPRTDEIRYIGQTSQPLAARLRGHRSAMGDTHATRWVRSLQGADCEPTIRALEECDLGALDEREIAWIAWGRANHRLTNATEGGGGTRGVPVTAEKREKLRIGRLGKTQSADARRRMSEAKKGGRLSAEHRGRIAAALRGVPKTPEHAANVGATHRGMRHTDEAKRRIGEAGLGRQCSEETRAKLSAAKLGVPHSPEHTEAIRVALRRRYHPEVEP